MALEQKDKGAHILDVNVGMPDVDEEAGDDEVSSKPIAAQAELPLCIDSSKTEVIEAALRIYPGRALVNSMSTKRAHIEEDAAAY